MQRFSVTRYMRVLGGAFFAVNVRPLGRVAARIAPVAANFAPERQVAPRGHLSLQDTSEACRVPLGLSTGLCRSGRALSIAAT